jgi:hypothetical protein
MEGLRKMTKILCVAAYLAEIGAKHVPNTDLELYLYTSQGVVLLKVVSSVFSI